MDGNQQWIVTVGHAMPSTNTEATIVVWHFSAGHRNPFVDL